MPASKPKELLQAELLMYKAKFNEALEILSSFEKRGKNILIDQLSSLILKGRIFNYIEQYKEAVEVGELAYQLSQKLGKVPDIIDALLIKSHVIYFGKLEDALDLISEAKILLNSISIDTSEITRQKSDFLLIKSV